MNSTYQQLLKNLEYLNLKQMIAHLGDTLDFSMNNQLSFVDTLVKLTNYEIDVREKNMINSMVKVAGFPHHKEISEFDFDFQPTINKQQMLDFISLRFLEEQENIVFLGTSGVGNYRKILFMERNKLKSRLLGRFMFISFHNSPQWMMFKNII